MASVEQRPNDYRVVWRQQGVKQAEKFAGPKQAEQFRLLVEAHGDRWPTGWIKGHGFTDAHGTAPTFTDWAARAIASRSTANARTRHDYQRDVTLHLGPTFGDIPLDLITREMVGAWLINLAARVSAKTAKNVHSLASSILADAIDERLVAHNPFRGAVAALPASKHEEMVFLTRGEFDTLQRGVQDDYRLLVRLLAYTGLRWSEATALRIRDVDILGRRLHVVQAWKRTPESYFEMGEPKSRRSRRTITIPHSLADELIPLTSRPGDELLFLTRYDRPVRHSNFRQRVWLPALRSMQRCGEHQDQPKPCGTDCVGHVPKAPRIHDLRHSHASWLIAAGVPLPAIQRRLGHESITTTIDRYGHLSPEMDDRIDAALGSPADALVPVDT